MRPRPPPKAGTTSGSWRSSILYLRPAVPREARGYRHRPDRFERQSKSSVAGHKNARAIKVRAKRHRRRATPGASAVGRILSARTRSSVSDVRQEHRHVYPSFPVRCAVHNIGQPRMILSSMRRGTFVPLYVCITTDRFRQPLDSLPPRGRSISLRVPDLGRLVGGKGWRRPEPSADRLGDGGDPWRQRRELVEGK